jgi:hypothetical protein
MKIQNKHILLKSIAEAKGLAYDHEIGLTEDDVTVQDEHQIAKRLLGQMTSEKDMATVESIVNVIIKLPNYEQLVESAREQLDLPKQPQLESHATGTPSWFRRMMNAVN